MEWIFLEEKKKYCPYCSKPLTVRKNDGKDRLYCRAENRFLYENPLPAATCLVFDDKNHILLVLRNREPGIDKWALPGGFIETGESPAEAAKRELEEETGIQASGPELVDVIFQKSLYYKTSILIIGYRFSSYEGETVAGDDAADARFFSVDEMPPLAFKSHETMITKSLEKQAARTTCIRDLT